MEKLKNKHDHALTQWLKVIIFGILMIAPFLSVLSRCLYVTCNKNAKDSYSDAYVEKYTAVSNPSVQYKAGNQFQALYNSTLSTATTGTFIIGDTDLYKFLPSNDERIINTFTVVGETYARINIGFTNGTTLRVDNWNTRYTSFYFTLKEDSSIASGSLRFIQFYLITYRNHTLDNAFEYSVNQLNETPIFNWVQNTAIYTPVNAMTNGLGFDANNNVMALLLTYWAILTAVYVLFDIIISCFVKITHLVSGNA